MAIIDRIFVQHPRAVRFLMKSKQFAIMYPMSVHALQQKCWPRPQNITPTKAQAAAATTSQPFAMSAPGEMSLEITLYAAGQQQQRERERGRGVGRETEAGQAFAARNVNIAVDTHTERVSRRSYRLQFNFLFLISRRIFIIFKPNICDFAAFPLDRVGGQAGQRVGGVAGSIG